MEKSKSKKEGECSAAGGPIKPVRPPCHSKAGPPNGGCHTGTPIGPLKTNEPYFLHFSNTSKQRVNLNYHLRERTTQALTNRYTELKSNKIVNNLSQREKQQGLRDFYNFDKSVDKKVDGICGKCKKLFQDINEHQTSHPACKEFTSECQMCKSFFKPKGLKLHQTKMQLELCKTNVVVFILWFHILAPQLCVQPAGRWCINRKCFNINYFFNLNKQQVRTTKGFHCVLLVYLN